MDSRKDKQYLDYTDYQSDNSMSRPCGESQPLLHTMTSFRMRPTSRRRCRLPSERVLTGAVLSLFFLVVVLLLIMQNFTSWRTHSDIELYPNYLEHQMLYYKDSDPPSNESFEEAWKKGTKLVMRIEELEMLLFREGILPPRRSASRRLQQFLKRSVPSKNVSYCAIIVEHVKRSLGNCVEEVRLPAYCHSPHPNGCDPDYPYRTMNGSCNNLRKKTQGMSETPFARLIDADYADGVSLPRVSALGDMLPNARLVSNRMYSHRTLPEANATLLFMNFGLFLDHDLVQIATQVGLNGSAISCCDARVRANPSLRHPECLEIDVPQSDCFYSTVNITCLDFIRSRPVPGKCPGQREQMNLATAYLDGSAIYGSNIEHAKELRTFEHGRLAGYTLNGTSLMPVDKNHVCGTPREPVKCFVSGDNRVNEHVDLVAIHNLWFREHNRVAGELEALNPLWDDEKIYQEARRIVIAELQHITYQEFLPLLLGPDAMEKYNLTINPNITYDGYDPDQDSSIFNVFAAAAYRFGHAMIQGMLRLYGKQFKPTGTIPLHETFLNPKVMFQGGFDNLLRGLVVQQCQSVESYVTTEVRDRLFQPPSGHSGLDLSAYGIQRGRDHGIAGYTAWRKACNLTAVRCWKDLYGIMDSERVDILRKLYLTIDDVDLAPAALSEYHAEGSMLGPTYQCLISRQFYRLRAGDRFWYESLNKTTSFTEDQLKEIYKASMTRILCDNSDNMTAMQKYAFATPSDTNTMEACNTIPQVNLTYWKDTSAWS